MSDPSSSPPGTAPRRRRSTAEVRQRIIEAATLEFNEKGYDRATSAAIARRAGVIEAQIFSHFGSKANLFRDVIFDPLLQELQDLTHGVDPRGEPQASHEAIREAEHDYTRRLQEFITANADQLRTVYAVSSTNPETFAPGKAIGSLNDYFARGAALNGRLTPPSPAIAPDLLVRISFATVLGSVMFKDWLYDLEGVSEAEVIEAVNRFVVHGLSINDLTGFSGTKDEGRD